MENTTHIDLREWASQLASSLAETGAHGTITLITGETISY